MTRYFVEVTLPDETTKIVEVTATLYRMLTGEDKPAPWFSIEKYFGECIQVRPLTYAEAKERGAYKRY